MQSSHKLITGILVVLVVVISFLGWRYLIQQSKQNITDEKPIVDIKNIILEDIVSSGIDCKPANGSADQSACSVEKIEGNFAKGNMPMAYWIAVKENGKWNPVIKGNGIPNCTDIDKYSIPKSIYGNCIETTGTLRN